MLLARSGLASALALCAAGTAIAQDGPPPESPTSTEWSPLQSNRFGSELGEKWIPVPNGDSGAPRQGWLATADGFFTREVHLAGAYTDSTRPDSFGVLGRFHYPFSRRLWAGIELPFYQEGGGRGNFGDIVLTTQVMLAEKRNLSINAGVGWRLPTGATVQGNNVFAAQPQLNLWTDVGKGIALRGRVGYEFANRGVADAFVMNAAIGQTVTPHSRAPFGDLTWYVSANWREPTSGRSPTFVSITPGMRTHIGNNLFFLAGVEFPVANRSSFFKQRYIFQLVQGF
ncbi:MAG: hypothetical protein C0476_09795 [Sphingomonas sp.]|nr:hypothetical protein [Sphingomonas sp.]